MFLEIILVKTYLHYKRMYAKKHSVKFSQNLKFHCFRFVFMIQKSVIKLQYIRPETVLGNFLQVSDMTVDI